MLFHYIIRLLGRFLWIRCDYEQPPQPGWYEVIDPAESVNVIAKFDEQETWAFPDYLGTAEIYPTHWKYQTRGPKGEFRI